MNVNANELLPPIVSPNPLELRPLPEGYTFTWLVKILNPNQQKLLWVAESETNWLSLKKSTGTLEEGRYELIQVMVDTTLLGEGEYKANLTFSWAADDNTPSTEVKVTLPVSSSSREVQQPSEDTPLVAGMSFALYPDSQEFLPLTISNPHEVAFEWQAATDQGTANKEWLQIDRKEGIIEPLEQQTINVTANAAGLKEGDYTGKVIINPQLSPTNLPVETNVFLHVLPQAKPQPAINNESNVVSLTGCGDIRVYSDSGPKLPQQCPSGVIVLSASAPSKQVVLYKDKNDGLVNWVLETEGANWLGVDKNNGSAPTNRINGTFQNGVITATINFTLKQNVQVGTSVDTRLTVSYAGLAQSTFESTTGTITVVVGS